MQNNVLVVAAHPDDEVLGCWGTIEKHRRAKDEVNVFIFGEGRSSELDNKLDSIPLLDVVKKIEQYIPVFPNIVYTHSKHDLNIDHRIIHDAVLTAFRPYISRAEIRCFEIASSTECGLGIFNPNLFVYLDPVLIEKKYYQLDKIYSKEMREFPHPRSKKYLEALASVRGAQAGVPMAEAFEIERRIEC